MTAPGRTTVFILAILAAMLLAAVVLPELIWLALLGNIIVLGACLLEGRMLKRISVTVTPNWPRRAQLGKAVSLPVRIENRSHRPLVVMVDQLWPQGMEADGQPLRVLVNPGEVVVAAFDVTPRQRGRVSFPPLEVTVGFKDDLARRHMTQDDGNKLSVYPDLKHLWTYDQLRRSRALSQMGVHRQRMMGVGREFELLRDYMPDDDYRNINWKATARRQRPVTNLYQAERSRDVMICVDAGRMMGNPIGKGTALDSVVDAAVLLAHVSNRQGDRVGLALFTDKMDTLLKPSAGSSAVNAIIERLVDAEPASRTSSYAVLVESLRASLNHRSLVFIFTDLNDPQLAQDLAEFLPLISRRHMVVTVSLRDVLLDQYAMAGAKNRQGVFEVLAARELANERDEHQRSLTKAGVQAIEADVNSLSLAVINRYMAIKSRQML